MPTQWVRSKWNPQATDEEKFKVARKRGSAYVIEMDGAEPDLYLPDSQYVPCDPPEQWQRVEVAMSAPDAMLYRDIIVQGENVGVLRLRKCYRVVSLVVERRKA